VSFCSLVAAGLRRSSIPRTPTRLRTRCWAWSRLLARAPLPRRAGLALARATAGPRPCGPCGGDRRVHHRRRARSSSGLIATVGRYYGRRTVELALGFARSAGPFRRMAAEGDPGLIW